MTDTQIVEWLEVNSAEYLLLPPADADCEWALYHRGAALVSSGKTLRECVSKYFDTPFTLALEKKALTHPPTHQCPDLESIVCGFRDCPHDEPLHYHHDGCPACYDDLRPEYDLSKLVRVPADKMTNFQKRHSPVLGPSIRKDDRC